MSILNALKLRAKPVEVEKVCTYIRKGRGVTACSGEVLGRDTKKLVLTRWERGQDVFCVWCGGGVEIDQIDYK